MHPLYEAANEVIEQLRTTRLEIVDLSAELAEAEYDLQLTQARVERALIKKVGSERALAPTVNDRARIFTLALDADKDYREQRKRRNELERKLEKAKAEAASLRDKLNVMRAAMRAAAAGA